MNVAFTAPPPMRRPTLHAGFERLLGTACVDHDLGHALLQDPRGTALRFGLAQEDAELIADIRAADLRTLARQLLPRLYGGRAWNLVAARAAG